VQIYHRHIDQRLCPLCHQPIAQLAVYLDLDRLLAMPALCVDDKRQRLSPQMPLHEGHGYGIDGSSRVDPLSCAESYAMRRVSHRHRIGPFYRPVLIPEQERHLLLQVIQHADHLVQGQL
jgi:hypothetical protein